MSISHEEVLRVATLSRLAFSAEELKRLEEDLARILDYVNTLGELDLAAIAPTAQVIPLVNRLRNDEPAECLPVAELERMAPNWEDDMYRVAPVFEE